MYVYIYIYIYISPDEGLWSEHKSINRWLCPCLYCPYLQLNLPTSFLHTHAVSPAVRVLGSWTKGWTYRYPSDVLSCVMVKLYCHKWHCFPGLPRLSYPRPASFPTPHSHPHSRPLRIHRQVPKCCQEPTGQFTVYFSIISICKWIICYPQFLKHRKDFHLDWINLISSQWKRSNFL